MKKTLLLYGGRSPEHDVSCESAAFLTRALRERGCSLFPVYIDRRGGMTYADTQEPLTLCYEKGRLSLRFRDGQRFFPEQAILLLHGTYGEDGAWQGLLTLASLPFIGADIRASALAMHKPTTKRLAIAAGVPALPFCLPHSAEEAEAAFPYPIMIKPASGGSSLGIGKAVCRDSLIHALAQAQKYGEVMAEPFLNAREVSVAVYQKAGDLVASPVGEVRKKGELFDYDTKYCHAEDDLLCPAPLSRSLSEQIRLSALTLCRLFGIKDMARADFFIDKDGKVYFNEINTLPGYTEHSLYPRLLTAAGVDPLFPFEEAFR